MYTKKIQLHTEISLGKGSILWCFVRWFFGLADLWKGLRDPRCFWALLWELLVYVRWDLISNLSLSLPRCEVLGSYFAFGTTIANIRNHVRAESGTQNASNKWLWCWCGVHGEMPLPLGGVSPDSENAVGPRPAVPGNKTTRKTMIQTRRLS